MENEVAILTEGGMGSGKSFFRGCRNVVDYLLPDTNKHIITNVPLDVDKVAEFVHKRKPELSLDSLKGRLHIISKKEQVSWETGANPVDYFNSLKLKDAYIIIDEAHHFWPDGTGELTSNVEKMKEFVSTLRHEEAQIEFITQAAENLHAKVRRLIQKKYLIIPNESRKIPFFKIPIGDIYELVAAFYTGRYDAPVAIKEQIKTGRKWETNTIEWAYRNPKYFGLYDTHGGVVREDESEAESAPKIYEYQKRSKLGLLWWFIKRNWFRSTLITIGFIALNVFIAKGGIKILTDGFMGKVRTVLSNSMKISKKKQDQADKPLEEVKKPLSPEELENQRLTAEYAENMRVKQAEFDAKMAEIIRQLDESGIREKIAKKYAEELENKISAASEIVMISGGKAMLKDGSIVQMGDWVRDEQIAKVNMQRRFIETMSGKRYGLGSRLSEVRTAEERGVSGISGTGTNESSAPGGIADSS